MEKSRKRITHIRNSSGMEFEQGDTDILSYDVVDSIIKDSLASSPVSGRRTIALIDPPPTSSHASSPENVQKLRKAEAKIKNFTRSQKFPLMEKTQKVMRHLNHNLKMPKPRAHLQCALDSNEEESLPPSSRVVKNLANGKSLRKVTVDKSSSDSVIKSKRPTFSEKRLDSHKPVQNKNKTIVPQKQIREDNRGRSESLDSSSSDDNQFEKFVEKEKRGLQKNTGSKRKGKRVTSSSKKDAVCQPSKAQNDESSSKSRERNSLSQKKLKDKCKPSKGDIASKSKKAKEKGLNSCYSNKDSEKCAKRNNRNATSVHNRSKEKVKNTCNSNHDSKKSAEQTKRDAMVEPKKPKGFKKGLLKVGDRNPNSEKSVWSNEENSAVSELPKEFEETELSYSNVDSDCYDDSSDDNFAEEGVSASAAINSVEQSINSHLCPKSEVIQTMPSNSMTVLDKPLTSLLEKTVSHTNTMHINVSLELGTPKISSVVSLGHDIESDDSDIEVIGIVNKNVALPSLDRESRDLLTNELLNQDTPKIAMDPKNTPAKSMLSSHALHSVPKACIKLETSSGLEYSTVEKKVKKEVVAENHNPVYMTNMCADFSPCFAPEESFPGRSDSDVDHCKLRDEVLNHSKNLILKLKSEDDDIMVIDPDSEPHDIKRELDEDIVFEFEGKVPKQEAMPKQCAKRSNTNADACSSSSPTEAKVPKLDLEAFDLSAVVTGVLTSASNPLLLPSSGQLVDGDIKELLDFLKKETQVYEHILKTESTFQENLKKLEMNQAEKVKRIKALIRERLENPFSIKAECSVSDSITVASGSIKTEADDLSNREVESFPYQKCAACGLKAVSACKKCAKIFFCSDTCGLRVWNERHKEECGK